MRKCKAEPVGNIFRQFLRESGLETPYNEYKLRSSIEEVLGQGISRFIVSSFIENQTLIVKTNSPILRQDLNMQRQQLVQKLNNAVGAQVITDIKFV